MNDSQSLSRLLDTVVDHLDIPPSLYQRAADRHRSFSEWLHRPESAVVAFEPDVSVQGSFRYGTVTRPVNEGDEYDLDNVCALKLPKKAMTQKELKQLFGIEVKAYAEAHKMLAPPEELHRCWRLRYADEVNFHLDTLPCVPEDAGVLRIILGRGGPQDLAALAVAITDRRHRLYDQITDAWLSSNPRGFALWFEGRARAAARRRQRDLVEARLYASIEDVPPYEWKTPLQRSIQILKRHRDVMFLHEPDLAPISMIITNLAANAYEGEEDFAVALTNIVKKMPDFINPAVPRVPNPAPANPTEDYAEKWSRDPRLERSFWQWHAAVKADLAKLPSLLRGGLAAGFWDLFRIDLTQDEVRELEVRRVVVPAVAKAAPIIAASSAPKPWGLDG